MTMKLKTSTASVTVASERPATDFIKIDYANRLRTDSIPTRSWVDLFTSNPTVMLEPGDYILIACASFDRVSTITPIIVRLARETYVPQISYTSTSGHPSLKSTVQVCHTFSIDSSQAFPWRLQAYVDRGSAYLSDYAMFVMKLDS